MLAKCNINSGGGMYTIESHDPVHNDIASLLTPRQLTRLSWPCNVPTRSPRSTSHTCVSY